ncbi:probable aminopeptidase NPEPL1 [Corticium candelabrum]|uniref:probable aminopeptidase NPEPL1 n=1 Tax=Corticium candelabrum TaxID=121492 RepID=UPI002E26E650|nr:probable aminopeptidase NPEPL1 [Corticium candelabrum]
MVVVELKFSSSISESDPQEQPCLIIGQLEHLKDADFADIRKKLKPRVEEKTFKAAVGLVRPPSVPGTSCSTCSVWLNKVVVAALPQCVSRHNSDARPHALTKAVSSGLRGRTDEVILVVCPEKEAFASACAIARAFPLFNEKVPRDASDGKDSSAVKSRCVTIEFLLAGPDKGKTLMPGAEEAMAAAADGIRLAAKIVDAPCNLMHTDIFLEHVRAVAKRLRIKPVIIQGESLDKGGFGGIYGVGKAAVHQPALAVLSHTPKGATKNIAWVGKGIVYDTGGLCIKDRLHMVGMKRDCGGAAAILGAFEAAVTLGFNENLHAIFCLAENAVGPIATRPDDIHKLYSGRTVEINNTDAEGRLVLGDGVAYARKDLNADVVVDMATLTGAQGISTGRFHAAVLTNKEDWEQSCMTAGKLSGDLVFPIPYSPELHFGEFNSVIADMKNSVADRSNAQSSCAGLFIHSHLGFDYPGVWVHLDIAAPCHAGERATGYGVAILLALFGQSSGNSLLQFLGPQCEISVVDNDAQTQPPPSKKRKAKEG